MADSTKEYAWYLEGNKIAIVEKDVNFDNNVDSKEFGPGTSRQLWKSPQTAITDGLEIKYTYSPTWRLNTYSTTQKNKFYVNGWTVIDGYLTFIRSHEASLPSWDSSPYSAIGDNEHIYVSGSDRWNGLHKVKSGGTVGNLQTFTRINTSIATVLGSSNIDIYGEGTGGASSTQTKIIANDSSNLWLNNIFTTGNYILLYGSAVAKNNGIWQVSGVQDDSSAESSSGIYVTNRLFCYDGDNTLSTEGIDTTPDTTLATDESVNMYQVYRDFCSIQADITSMQDESFDLDLPSYLQKALVYYVKAKVAEDSGELKLREYAMREFKKMVEKYETSRISGPRMVFPGAHGIR